MALFLVREEIIFSRKSSCMSLAGSDRATMRLRPMDLACMPVETPFVPKARMFAAWNSTDVRLSVLILVFAENVSSSCGRSGTGTEEDTVKLTVWGIHGPLNSQETGISGSFELQEDRVTRRGHRRSGLPCSRQR